MRMLLSGVVRRAIGGFLIAIAVLKFGTVSPLAAQEEVAKVGNYVVLQSEIDLQVGKLVGQQQVSDKARSAMEQAALAELVKRQLVMHYLERREYLPNQTQLQIRLDILNEGFASSGTTLQAYLKRSGLSREKFIESVKWKMGWRKYLDKYMTDENVESFFQKHQADFDGRKVEAAHILLKVGSEESGETWEEAEKKLTSVQQQIGSGELTFAEAAAKFSQASTGKSGGRIGLIERHGSMHESFSTAAFALAKDEISQPVRSPFGVHLIQCLGIEKGKETWRSVRNKVEVAMKKYLFEWLAELEKKHVQVEYASKYRNQ